MKKYYLIFYILGWILAFLLPVYVGLVAQEYSSSPYSVVTKEQAMIALALAIASGIFFLLSYLLKRRLISK